MKSDCILDAKTGARAPWHSLQIDAYRHLACLNPPDFDADKHEYTYRGKVYPSVTQILFAMGAISEFSTWSEYARDLGTVVHRAIAMLDDQFDWLAWDYRIWPYLYSFLEWKHKSGAKIQAQEQRGINLELGYAGTLDLRCEWEAHGTLYLQSDGSMAKFQRQTNQNAWHVFVSMCNTFTWLRQNNLGGKNGS